MYTLPQFEERYKRAVEVRFNIFSQLTPKPSYPTIEEVRAKGEAAYTEYEAAAKKYDLSAKATYTQDTKAMFFIKYFLEAEFSTCLTYWDFDK